MKPESISRSLALAALYFLFATILTSWFIARKFWLYESVELMALSASIAGVKWAIQIIAALILLKEQRWVFIKNIGLVALIGSIALFLYYILPARWGFGTLAGPVVFSIVIMMVLYYRMVKQMELSLYWFWSWIISLILAVLLQLTLVFDVV